MSGNHYQLVISVMFLLKVTNLESSPMLHYDKERYEYEDKLIRGKMDVQKPSYKTEFGLFLFHPHIPTKPPSFVGPNFLNLTAAPGTTVVLPCRVLHMGSASLSWLRRPQLTVLSSGNTLFSSSPRLRLLHDPGSPDWTLQIGPLVPEDEGTYECQVNTEPKLSRVVQLNVMAGSQLSEGKSKGPGPAMALQGDSSLPRLQKTEILAPDTMRVFEGGTATLECVVTEHEVAPPYFTWYILGVPLDFSHPRGGILLQTEKKRRSSASRLTLTRMVVSDSGPYTCSPAGAYNATVHIEVKEVQNRNSSFSTVKSSTQTLPLKSFWKIAWTLVKIL
eukprot:GFUD01067950.1.p1 GENE.GFUD01067950.1~~GFUD01067950.1.p1  ORF type:complete len:333 (+),score=81.11 GFUD01067950.1:485-1483(+)